MDINIAPPPEGENVNDMAWFREHLNHLAAAVPRCPYCEVTPLLGDLYDIWRYGTAEQFELMWSHADGYGEPGTIPPQGYDWSGVRDASPAAIRAMHKAVFG